MRQPLVAARLWLLAWFCGVLLVTMRHELWPMAALLVVLLVTSGREIGRLMLRTLLAVLLFNSVVSIGYALSAWWSDSPFVETLMRLNLRVVTLTYLAFFMLRRIDFYAALSFSPTLLFFLTLSRSQIEIYRLFYRDFVEARESRSPLPLSRLALFELRAIALRALLLRLLHDAEERSLALRSRAFFESESELERQ